MLGLNELRGQQSVLTGTHPGENRNTIQTNFLSKRTNPHLSERRRKEKFIQMTGRVLLNGSVLDGAGQNKKTRAVVSIKPPAQIDLSVCS